MSFLIEKYAFREGCCTRTPVKDTAPTEILVSGPCYSCKETQNVQVLETELERFREGDFAQNCFRKLPSAAREFLISGICDKCWNDMFGEEA